MDWQTPAAVVVVAFTVLVFAVRILRRRGAGKRSCGGDCDCPGKKRR